MKNDSKLVSVYLDHAAISPMRPEVVLAMVTAAQEAWGNPSSLHRLGREAKAKLEQARARVAEQLISCTPEEVVFTSGGTESNVLALCGVALQVGVQGMHIISQPTEHVSVLRTLAALEKAGAEVTWLPVDEFGQVKVLDLSQAMRSTTAVVSIMSANNEIGTLQPVAELVMAAKQKNPQVVFHTDACQSAGIMDVRHLGKIDLLSFTGTKFGGPHAGALYIKKGVQLQSVFTGGGQEHDRRSGTQAVPEIVGLQVAVELAMLHQKKIAHQLSTWRDQIIHTLLALPGARLNGHPKNRLPQNIHMSFEGISGESILVALDQAGIQVSTGSACAAGSQQESSVLRAIGLPKTHIRGSLRLSLGWNTTAQEVAIATRLIPPIISDLAKIV